MSNPVAILEILLLSSLTGTVVLAVWYLASCFFCTKGYFHFFINCCVWCRYVFFFHFQYLYCSCRILKAGSYIVICFGLHHRFIMLQVICSRYGGSAQRVLWYFIYRTAESDFYSWAESFSAERFMAETSSSPAACCTVDKSCCMDLSKISSFMEWIFLWPA